MNKNVKVGLALILASAILMTASGASFVSSLTIPNTGTVKNLMAFWDQGATSRVDAFIWGDVAPDSTQTKMIWLKNTGASSVVLSMVVGNWTPVSALYGPQNYMGVSWNRESVSLGPGSILSANITLTIYANATSYSLGGFSFDITFNGT